MGLTVLSRMHWNKELSSANFSVAKRGYQNITNVAVTEVVLSILVAITALTLACGYQNLPDDFFISQEDCYITAAVLGGNAVLSYIIQQKVLVKLMHVRIQELEVHNYNTHEVTYSSESDTDLY